jgi:glycine cleavage system T protein (aminomethyltransferase)
MNPFYSSKEDEYRHLRCGVGITDWSHLSKVQVTGPDAVDLVNRLVISDVSKIAAGRLTSTYMLDPGGRIFADCYVWNQGNAWLIVSEGPSSQDVLEHIGAAAKLPRRGETWDVTADRAMFGVEGPFAWQLLGELLGKNVLRLRYLDALPRQRLADVNVDILRAGKTGEFGYLVVCPMNAARRVWEALLHAGRDFDAIPCGMDALELCKFENGFINLRHEGARAHSALELNCRALLCRAKTDYIGKEAIEGTLSAGLKRHSVGLSLEDRGVISIHPGAAVEYRGEEIGTIGSADYSFMLGCEIALAFLDREYAYAGCLYDVQTDVGLKAARTVSAPFVFNNSLKVGPEDNFFAADWSLDLSSITETCPI